MRNGKYTDKFIVLGNYNTQEQASQLTKLLTQSQLDIDVSSSLTQDPIQELLAKKSIISSTPKARAILILIKIDLIKQNNLKEYISYIAKAINHANDNYNIPLFVFCMPSSLTTSNTVQRYFIKKLKQNTPAIIEDITQNSATLNTIFDNELYNLISDPYSEQYKREISFTILHTIRNHLDIPFKAIVIDADNTLWTGVCAENNIDEITISKAQFEFQCFLLECIQNGFVICVSSKNIEADVFHIINNHPGMILQKEDFSDWEINWNNKSENIAKLSKRLNIALDNFIFIDDNPAECITVAKNLPSILTMRFLNNGDYIKNIRDIWAFDTNKKCSFAIYRSNYYKTNVNRLQLKSQSIDYKSFLSDLNIAVTVSKLDTELIDRISELSYRCTQFNFANQKLSAKKLMGYINHKMHRAYVVSAKDKFSNYGVVGFLTLKVDSDTGTINNFILSCRAINKGIEHTIINHVASDIATYNLSSLSFDFVETKRNIPAKLFLESIAKKSKTKSNCYKLSLKNSNLICFDPNSEPKQHKISYKDNNIEKIFHNTSLLTIASLYGILKLQKEDGPILSSFSFSNNIKTNLTTIWEKYFNKIKKYDVSIFSLGADSLLISQLISNINKCFGVKLGFKDIYEYNTFNKLLCHLKTKKHVSPLTLNKTSTLSLQFPPTASSNQTALLALDQVETTWGYNITIPLLIKGEIDFDSLKKAIAILVKSHQQLNVSFVSSQASILFQEKDKLNFSINSLDMSSLKLKEIISYCKQQAATPFDLSKDRLVQFSLLKYKKSQHVLLIIIHHIVFDGWSKSLFFKQLSYLYKSLINKTPIIDTFKKNDTSYYDFCKHEAEWLNSNEANQQKCYWKKQLNNAQHTKIKPDLHISEMSLFEGNYKYFAFKDKTYAALKKIASSHNSTIFNTILSAFILLVHKYVESNDILIASPFWNRENGSFNKTIGYITNILPLRIEINPGETFSNFIQQVSKTTIDAHQNQKLPFPHIVSEANFIAKGYKDKSPSILFSFQNESTLSLEGLEVSPLYKGTDFPRFDILFEISNVSSHLEGGIYCTKNYSPELVDAFITSFLFLAEEIETYISTPIKMISIKQSQTQIYQKLANIKKVNDTPSLTQAFKKQLTETNKNNIALRTNTETLSYEKLNILSDIIANSISKKIYSSTKPIGLYMAKSPELIACILALAKLGIPYVPFDISHPHKYVLSIIDNANIDTIIVNEIDFPDNPLVKIPYNELLEHNNVKTLDTKTVKDSSALYILYTSGTTGAPKGVIVTQSNFSNLLEASNDIYKIDSTDKIILFHTPSFDVGQWEIWLSLTNGAELYIPTDTQIKLPNMLSNALHKEKITFLSITPSSFQHFCESFTHFPCNRFENLRSVVFSGEPLALNILKLFLVNNSNGAIFYNMYGITETTVHTTIKRVDLNQLESKINNIGKTIRNTAILILNNNLNLQPIGAIGEIYVAGNGISLGYINNPNLTKENFSDINSIPIYKSGDFARYIANNEIEYLGRKDDQVKLRGYRIDTYNITTLLLNLSSVENAVVLVRNKNVVNAALSAYIVPSKKNAYPVYKIIDIEKRDCDSKFYTLPNGLTISHYSPTESETLYQEIFINNEYIKNGIHINDEDIIFDVGANIGMFSLKIALSNKKVSVFAFEPIKQTFDKLKDNIEIYNLQQKVLIFNTGIYSEKTAMDFTYYPNASVLSSAHAKTEQERDLIEGYIANRDISGLSEKTLGSLVSNQLQKMTQRCNLNTISNIIEEHNIQKIDLLKIDAEKSELHVLLGINEKHWAIIKQLAIEVHDINHNLEKITSLLKEKGYRINIVKNNDMRNTILVMVFASRHSLLTNSTRLKVVNNFRWASKKSFLTHVKNNLQAILPPYSLPSEYKLITAIPLTKNGKIDKNSLLHLNKTLQYDSFDSNSRTKLETSILLAWKAVLQRSEIKIYDNFFEVGGNSLLLMRLYDHLIKLLPNLEITDLLKYPTIHSLASSYESSNQQGTKQEELLDTSNKTINRDHDIAIIGYAFKLPNTNTQSLWADLLEKKSFINTYSLEELKNHNVPASTYTNPNFIARSSLIEDMNLFDAELFNIVPVDARLMDPQHRVFMELAWESLENAGYSPEKFDGDIGISCGVGVDNYHSTDQLNKLSNTTKEIFGQKDFLATKIAYKLNLTGPAINVNTACSTGLVNVVKACQSLILEDADIMLAGSVSLVQPNCIGYIHEQGGILASDGECRPFSKDATGTILSSGAVIFVLKKLSTAIHDNDNIHAVIKGYAINNDGHNKVNFAAPSILGQKKCISKAIQRANIKIENIKYVEAHGSGTKLGDSLELQALIEAYREFTNKDSFCSLGSIKANFGHTDRASGSLGLLKSMLIIKNKVIPPQINCPWPITEDKEKSPFYITKEAISLREFNNEFYTAVSSFGIGGTNTHVILAPPPSLKIKESILLPNIIVLSAKNPVALNTIRLNLLAFIKTLPDNSPDILTKLCFTLQSARTDLNCRIVYAITNKQVAIKLLSIPITDMKDNYVGPIEELPQNIQSTASKWLRGRSVEWNKLYISTPQRLNLPNYPFQRKAYWHSAGRTDSIANNACSKVIEKDNSDHTSEKVEPKDIEQGILQIFCDSLGYDSLNLSDNFEDLGGDSLVAIDILSLVEKQHGCTLTIDDIFIAPNIQETISKVLHSPLLKESSKHIMHMRVGKPNVAATFIVHPGNGGMFHYLPFIKHFEVTGSIYGFENQLFNDSFKAFNTIEDMAYFYLQKMKSIQTSGPYTLLGWSFGGVVAFEMARQLENMGENKVRVILIDSWAKHNDLWSESYFQWICDNSFSNYESSKEEILLSRFKDRNHILNIYKPANIKSDVFLFKANKPDKEFESVNHPSNYWEHYVSGNLTIIPSKGNHISMMSKENVYKLAQQCVEVVDGN